MYLSESPNLLLGKLSKCICIFVINIQNLLTNSVLILAVGSRSTVTRSMKSINQSIAHIFLFTAEFIALTFYDLFKDI